MTNLLEPLELRRLMWAGELDPNFGTGGIADAGVSSSAAVEVLRYGPSFWPPNTLVVSREGAAGDAGLIAVRRLTGGGHPDATFGGGDGVVFHSGIAGLLDSVSSVRELSGGKLLVGGTKWNNVPGAGLRQDPTVMRLNADGSLDTSFGGPAHGHAGIAAGIATVSFVEDAGRDPATMAVAPDGRIALVTTVDGSGYAAVLTPDGALDTTFDGDGKLKWGIAVQGVPNETAYRAGVAGFRPDGSLVVGGTVIHDVQTDNPAGGHAEQAAVRAYDVTGAELWRWQDDSAAVRAADDVAVLPDGSLLVAATLKAEDGALLRLTPAGALDATFGEGSGRVAIDYPQPAGAQRIERLIDGRVVVLGEGGGQVFLSRHTPEGAPDPTFSAILPVDTSYQQLHDLRVRSLGGDDDMVVLTARHRGDFQGDLLVRRFDAGGPRLTRNGTLLISGTSGNDQMFITRRLRDGRILVRYNGDGSLEAARVFLPQLVRRIQLYAHGGHDLVGIGAGVRSAFLHGGDGNDTLGGGDGDDYLVGAVGNDSLIGDLGNDTLEGNAGNDYLLGSAGHDVIHGHGGADHLIGAGGNDRLFGGPGSADVVHASAGFDAAAYDPLDTYDGVEELLS